MAVSCVGTDGRLPDCHAVMQIAEIKQWQQLEDGRVSSELNASNLSSACIVYVGTAELRSEMEPRLADLPD